MCACTEFGFGELGLKLPHDWYDFKIVETSEGCFTGQIRTERPSKFTDDNRKQLVQLTREYIQEQTGMKVEYWEPNLRD